MKNFGLLIFIIALLSSCSSDNTSEPFVPDDDGDNPIVETYTDDEIMDLVQKDGIKYFWDYAHPVSKLARERYHEDNPAFEDHIITTGGSGFGLMTLIVGIERGFIPRAEAVSRLHTALDFLANADRFHGAWPHWMDGTTGNVIQFGNMDNGGDLVETAFLCQGLITIHEYFKNGNENEQALAQKADDLWKGVEWDWYTRGGEHVLYWHWSPQYEWQMNFRLEGYNECLITYVIAAASPTHTIQPEAYHEGWTRNGAIVSNATKYGFPVVFNHNGHNGSVGPLFWAQYSHLGLDPRGLTDQYGNYWNLTANHAEINYAYAVDNPLNFTGYGENLWGLTAGYTRNPDGSTGYTAHSIDNDNGVITPTAALSSFPYTPEKSMNVLRYLYEQHADEYIGVAGPYDAISPHYNWKAERYLAIDQGTIAPMIENYRSGLLWNLFMQNSDVRQGLQTLGFQSSQHGF